MGPEHERTMSRARRTARAATGLVAATLTVALLASACASSGSNGSSASPGATEAPSGPSTVIPADEGTPKDGGKLAFGIDAEPDGFDTSASQLTATSHLIASSMLEALVVFDANREPKPFLAESIVPSDLAAKWVITMKPNITFHDGAPLNAEAVKANIDATKVGIGGLALKPLESVTVTGPLTVEVKMSQPFASFPSLLAAQGGYMISPASIGTPGAATSPVGTGPFVFDRWDRGTGISVKKNPNYWQAGKPHLDAIDYKIISDPSSRENSLAAGDLDLIFTDQTTTIKAYKGKPGFKTIIDASGDAQNIIMNEAVAPFDNVNARKALTLATDSKALTETVGEGILKPTDQPFADGTTYSVADSHYPAYNLDLAKKAVAQYTTETGKPMEFTLTIFTGTANLALAQVLQEQWAKAGITAKISSQNQAEAITSIVMGQTQANMASNFGYPDPDFNYLFWHSSFTSPVGQLSINFPHMKNDALDKLLLDGRVSLVPQQRKEAYQKAAQLLNDNSVYVWLYRYVAALIASDSVRGLRQAEAVAFSNFSAKGWYGDLWLSR